MTTLPPEVSQTGGLVGSFIAVFFAFKLVNGYVEKEVKKETGKIEKDFEEMKARLKATSREAHTILAETSSEEVKKAIHRMLVKLIH